MYKRCEYHPDRGKKRNTTVYAVQSGKYFGIIGGQISNGAHTGQNHGSVVKAIHPA